MTTVKRKRYIIEKSKYSFEFCNLTKNGILTSIADR